MRIRRCALPLFVLLGVFLFAYSYWVLRGVEPTLEGEIRTGRLRSPVRIIRDVYAIPHIYAKNTHDLLFAQGYITAQDRLWQMDLSRRIATGRLSEIFGKDTVEIDYFFRALELKDIAERIYMGLDDESREELDSYASGVNLYIESGKKTLESIVLGYDIEPWSPVDSISIHLLSAFDLSINMDEEIFAIKALRRFGEETLGELLHEYPKNGGMIIPEGTRKSSFVPNIPEGYRMAREEFGLFQGKGASNNWVIDGTRSMSGKPLLANDPHLRAQIPSVWHEIHLKASGINVIGVTFPGSPYVLIGHNERVAWGFTDAMVDRVDLFIERISPENPREYWYVDRWERMRTKRVEIGIKEGSGYSTIVKEIDYTRHGPVISPFEPGVKEVLSMGWTGSTVKDQTIKALSILNRAKNVEDVRKGGRYSGIYTLNVVCADVDGNIGYQLVGGVPVRGKETAYRLSSLHGKLPVPGWTDKYEWKGFIPYEELPGLSNPPLHSIATANNRIVGEGFPYLISSTWALPYRYERIVSLLEEKGRFSLEDLKRMQADVYSVPARRFVDELLGVRTDNLEVRWVLEELSDWDYEVRSTSLPALLYEVIRMDLIRNAFQDELGDIYPDFLYTLNFNQNPIDNVMEDPDSHWWDDTGTPHRESRDEMIVRSIGEAIREIGKGLGMEKGSWSWGRLHRYRFIHPLGRGIFLDRVFNPKPIPAEGDRDTINNSYFGYKRRFDPTEKTYDAAIIPSYRFIVDLSDINHALGMNSTGESGNPLSGRYSDMMEDWSQVKYHPLLFDDRDVEKNKWKELRLY
ncbi:MAG TPA: penicillin acylase family protein [Thermodesulfobacteriota bacterium]|nr:penicillin acylase family protein [Thermodesulfobacteriota bacterium]